MLNNEIEIGAGTAAGEYAVRVAQTTASLTGAIDQLRLAAVMMAVPSVRVMSLTVRAARCRYGPRPLGQHQQAPIPPPDGPSPKLGSSAALDRGV